MQDKKRRQQERTEATRAAMITAGRRLFVEKGYAETSTPELVKETGLTRGALYHHFADKRALFQAVAEKEAEDVAKVIETASAPASALKALQIGGRQYLEAMTVPGRTRLLLIEAPAVLGLAEMDRIQARHGDRTLRDGLHAAMAEGAIKQLPLGAATAMLGAMFDRAALSIEEGTSLETCLQVINAVIDGLQTVK